MFSIIRSHRNTPLHKTNYRYSSTIIEAIRDNYPPDSGTVISFFYFDSNDPEKRRYDAFLASLIAQLSAQASAIPEVLEDLYCSCAKGSRTPSTKILERTFKALVKIFQRVYILVDGLDECSQRSQLLALITEISAWKVRKPHILVTSRKESDIAEALIPIVKAKLGLRAAIANAEIELYIRAQLQTNKAFRVLKTRGKKWWLA